MTITPTLKLDDFDEAVRVQDDLYHHVNGGWLARTEIPADRSSWGAFAVLAEDAQRAVREIIEGLDGNAAQGTPEQQIHDLYASFMDTERIEHAGAEPLRPSLAYVDAVSSIDEIGRLLGWVFRTHHKSLLGLGAEADPGDPQRYVCFVGQDGLGLPDEAYYRLPEHEMVRVAYRDHVERMLDLAGVPEAADQADRVVALETEIARHHWDQVTCRDMQKMYNPMSFDELAASAPGLRLVDFAEEARIPEEAIATVVNAQPSFFTEVAALATPERLEDWKAWARWRVVESTAMLLSEAFVAERFSFVGTTLQGTPQLKERWKRGVELVEGTLGEAVGKLYVERHFSPVAKERMDGIVANLLKAYEQSIKGLDWMTDETKAAALDKLSKFRPKIGYPDKWRDYSALDIRPDDLVGNAMRAVGFELDFETGRMGKPMDPDEWLMPPQAVNAYYHPLRNEIVFPAAILQPPFFNVDADDAVNYGGIGAVIGHEIGHGFDDQGSTCDGDGLLRNWWSDADREAFGKRTQALIEQYDALVLDDVPDMHVNGALTVGENIGDLGGLSIAIKAWRIATHGQEVPEIDGYTGLQRLFLSWAAVWQRAIRPEAAKLYLANDPHSPNLFRCNQIVRNIDDFYDAFGVTESDQLWLDPAQRISIW